ncbi:MAG TPA: hypothetical protein EYP59_17455 [Thiotrichaceae bacterium]|nr:hypothetical protein [Thiotrichaceae bacterium]
MKKIIVFLGFVCLSSHAWAIYDFATINTIPRQYDMQFCFGLDRSKVEFGEPIYIADKLYLAALTNQEIFLVNALENGVKLTNLNEQTEPQPFIQGESESEICLGPFPKENLKDYQLIAGIGDSLNNMIQKEHYKTFFSGFTNTSQFPKNWTIMVYMVGSDLESRGRHASKDFLEMLQGSSQSPPDISNLIITTGGSTRNGWQTVKRTFIQNGQQYVLEDLGAKSMADPQTLSDFVIWAKANFPAQHYALILWNHGNGSNGYGYDTSKVGNKDIMSLPELHQAYQTIHQESDDLLDIVVYDACLMASIEVAEVTATVAKVMAGSAELEPPHGIDYAHLLSHVGTSPPDNGLTFGSLVKTGYIQHAKEKGTFEDKQITYSVFDLAQLTSFSIPFNNFAIEFNKALKSEAFVHYERLSRGLIRAPGYPSKQTGRLRSLDNDNIPIDLYSFLQTVGPNFLAVKIYAAQLLTIIDKMVVDYDGNIDDIDPNAGRVSLDIGSDKSYLVALPKAYTLFNEGLEYYNLTKKDDVFVPDGELVCPKGLICAFAQWLELAAEDILGIEAYFGQKEAETSTVYLIDPAFYQYRELTENLELGVNGHQACQYQLCVSETQCEDITLTQQGNQLLADISLNDSPTVLSFCNHDEQWLACGVVQQTDGIWGRDEGLYFEDSIIPSTLHVQGNQTELRQGKTLRVHDPVQVRLKKSCDQEKAAIWAKYYSLNQRSQIEVLCDSGDCVCQPDDTDQSCKEIGFKAGVYLTQ